jgi:hypothetical protein
MWTMNDPTNPLGYSISKDRLRPGWSYPVKRSLLDRALIEAGVTSVSNVTYVLDTRPLSDPHRPPLSVTYLGMAERCMITVRSVPAESRLSVADALAKRLGDVAQWIASVNDRTPTWRSEWHQIHAILTVDGVRLTDELPPA